VLPGILSDFEPQFKAPFQIFHRSSSPGSLVAGSPPAEGLSLALLAVTKRFSGVTLEG
jgi:hypothetical protein